MDQASPRRPAGGTRRSRRTDTSNPDDRRARHALPPRALRFRIARPPPQSSQSRRDARPRRFPAQTDRPSLARPRAIGRRDRRRLDELEHEAIGLTAMLEHDPGAMVFKMAQRARRAGQFEARLLDILDQKILVDSMQRGGLRIAGARLGAMID